MTLKELEDYCKHMRKHEGVSGNETVWMLIQPVENATAIPYQVGSLICMKGCKGNQKDIPLVMPDLDKPPMYVIATKNGEE